MLLECTVLLSTIVQYHQRLQLEMIEIYKYKNKEEAVAQRTLIKKQIWQRRTDNEQEEES